MREKPVAPACERNREAIAEVLRAYLTDTKNVLEIGSGTGQHAVYFAEQFPQLIWQPSDLAANLPGIRSWLDDAELTNVRSPLVLDVAGEWPQARYDAVFCANTLHIMGWRQVEALFAGLPAVMTTRTRLVIYGPFFQQGRPAGEGNARFDAVLRGQSGDMGIRDIEAVDALAVAAGLTLIVDKPMPANNRCLVWRRGG